MSIPKILVIFLLIIVAASLVDYLLFGLLRTLGVPGLRIPPMDGRSFMLILHAVPLLVLGTAVRAFKPKQSEWLVGGAAAAIALIVLHEMHYIFVFV